MAEQHEAEFERFCNAPIIWIRYLDTERFVIQSGDLVEEE